MQIRWVDLHWLSSTTRKLVRPRDEHAVHCGKKNQSFQNSWLKTQQIFCNNDKSEERTQNGAAHGECSWSVPQRLNWKGVVYRDKKRG